MDIISQLITRARASKQRIVLPEGSEGRTLRAADRAIAEGLADIILLGDPKEIKSLAAEWNLMNIGGATIIDPSNNPKAEAYAEIRPMTDRVVKHKGFYEWYGPGGVPSGSGHFKGSAGTLCKAIAMLRAWAEQYSR